MKSIPVFQSQRLDSQSLGREVTSILHDLGLLRSFYNQSRNGKLPQLIRQTPKGSPNSCKRPELNPQGVSLVPGWLASTIVGLPLAIQRMTLAIMNIRSWETLGICKFPYHSTLTRSPLGHFASWHDGDILCSTG